jgi:hypothetical protein
MEGLENSEYSARRRWSFHQAAQTFDCQFLDGLALCGGDPFQTSGEIIWDLDSHSLIMSRIWKVLLFYGFDAAEAQVVIGVAMVVQDLSSMPEGGAPAAPVFVGAVGIEDEPAALQFRVA